MDPYLAFGIVAGAALAVDLIRRVNDPEARQERAFRRALPVSVAKCAEGQWVKVEGRVEAREESVLTPVTGEGCIGYMLSVAQVGSRDQSEPWVELATFTEVRAFALRDASGVARVQPGRSDVLLMGTGRTRRMSYGDAPDKVRTLLARRGFDQAEVGGRHAMLECMEVVLDAGGMAVVGGVASWEPDASGEVGSESVAFRGSPRGLRLRAPTGAKLIIDLPDARAPAERVMAKVRG